MQSKMLIGSLKFSTKQNRNAALSRRPGLGQMYCPPEGVGNVISDFIFVRISML